MTGAVANHEALEFCPGVLPVTPLLQIRNLRVSFGGVRAIDGVDLDVDRGAIVGVIGPNGSGKTTTFNVVTGLVQAASGSIQWAGTQELVGLPPWTIFRLGIARTFQNIRLPLGLSVLENVMLGLYPHEQSNWTHVLLNTRKFRERGEEMRTRAQQALRLVSPSLAESPARLVVELSYADRRRIEIARAIASEPKLLLLDEPTAGMNAAETLELAADIKKVSRSGITIVLVEHKMKFVSDLASRVVVFNHGRKIADGAYEKIRSDENVIQAYLGRRRAAQA